MILSKKTQYAIVALTRLAREYGNGPMQIREIAEKEKISRRVFLRTFCLSCGNSEFWEASLANQEGTFCSESRKK